MNNPVNMWDPTGHVPEWVGDSIHFEYMEDNLHPSHMYELMNSWYSSSDWYLINEIKSNTQITYEFQSTITQ